MAFQPLSPKVIRSGREVFDGGLERVTGGEDHFASAPDRWGFYIENNNSTLPALDKVMDVIHWNE